MEATEPIKPTKQSDYYYYNPELVPTKFGVNNTGAICWFNSLFQNFLGISSLNQVLLEHSDELADNAFAMEYIRVLRATLPNRDDLPPPDVRSLAISSAAILGALLTKAHQKGLRKAMGTGQECVDEAFILIIEMFDCRHVDKLFRNVYELFVECKGCNKKVSTVRDKSYRIQLFTQAKLNTEQKFCDFLKIHPSECDYYKCDCGHAMSKFYRIERLKMLREVVVIIFNKFQLKDNRWFPQTLKFGSNSNTTLTYQLIGKVEHSGTTAGGHYWAQSYRDSSWHKLNDSSVSLGDPSATPSTFMAVYHICRPIEMTNDLSESMKQLTL